MEVIDSFKNEHSFLSNFYQGDGTSIEHRYQAAKTTDLEWKLKILKARTPGDAKRLSRKAPMRKDWEEEKQKVMIQELSIKFSDLVLAKKLVDTGNAEIIEGNWWHDNHWRDCRCRGCATIVGKNILGKMLMLIRQFLKSSDTGA